MPWKITQTNLGTIETKIFTLDVDSSGNVALGIATTDPVFNFDTTSRISTQLIYASVPTQGTYNVGWSKLVDVSSTTKAAYPVAGAFSINDDSSYAIVITDSISGTNKYLLLIDATTGSLNQSYFFTPGEFVYSIFMTGSLSSSLRMLIVRLIR